MIERRRAHNQRACNDLSGLDLADLGDDCDILPVTLFVASRIGDEVICAKIQIHLVVRVIRWWLRRFRILGRL